MKSETLFETLTTATEALRTVQPLLKMKPAEFERYAGVMAALRLEVRRVLGGEFSPEQYRLLKPWRPEPVKVDRRSPELLALIAEETEARANHDANCARVNQCRVALGSMDSYFIAPNGAALSPNTDAEQKELAAALADAAETYSILEEAQTKRVNFEVREQARQKREAEQAEQAAKDAELAARKQEQRSTLATIAARARQAVGIRA